MSWMCSKVILKQARLDLVGELPASVVDVLYEAY